MAPLVLQDFLSAVCFFFILLPRVMVVNGARNNMMIMKSGCKNPYMGIERRWCALLSWDSATTYFCYGSDLNGRARDDATTRKASGCKHVLWSIIVAMKMETLHCSWWLGFTEKRGAGEAGWFLRPMWDMLAIPLPEGFALPIPTEVRVLILLNGWWNDLPLGVMKKKRK